MLFALAAGDMIPADIRIIESKDLFVSQASLTGESDPVEKFPEINGRRHSHGSVIELDNICYMGSTVISGSAKGIVFGTGNDTYLGTIARSLVGERATTAFDKGISKVSFLLIRFMLVMVPFVFFVNGFTKGDWFEAFIFALSVAVGLTPEHASDDSHSKPLERCCINVEEKNGREESQCHPELRGHEHSLYRQDRYADLR